MRFTRNGEGVFDAVQFDGAESLAELNRMAATKAGTAEMIGDDNGLEEPIAKLCLPDDVLGMAFSDLLVLDERDGTLSVVDEETFDDEYEPIDEPLVPVDNDAIVLGGDESLRMASLAGDPEKLGNPDE